MGATVKAGQPAFLETTVRDADGNAADPTTLTLTVRDLAGATVFTKSKPQLTLVTQGVYRYFPSTGTGGEIPLNGTYFYEWESTGPNGDETDWLDVVAVTPPGIINLADAKGQIDKTKTKNDAEIRFFVDAVNSRVESEWGPIMPRQVTEVVTVPARGASTVKLSVVRVVESAPWTLSLAGSGAVDTTGWTISRYGRITPAPGSSLVPGGVYTAAVVAGLSPVPPDVVLGARELFADWWRTQRVDAPAGLGSLSDADPLLVAQVASRGYAIPNMIAQKFARYAPLPGSA